jgi:hypothetical protein
MRYAGTPDDVVARLFEHDRLRLVGSLDFEVKAPAAAREHEGRAADFVRGPFGALVAGDVAGDLDVDVRVVADVVGGP